ncbi:unnamed protein product [Caenorhabditis brenneri]
MPKRANTNGHSSTGGSSATDVDGRRKLRRLAATPRNSATSSTVAVRSDRPYSVPVQTGFSKCSPILLPQSDIIIVGQTPLSNLPQNAIFFANFEARLPWIDSTEALNGQKYGSLILNTDYPGIPSKKFEAHQAPKAKTNKKWPVQAVYKAENNKWKVSYEGWSSDSIDTYDVTEVDEAYIMRFQLRADFLEAYNKLAGPSSTQPIENWLHLCQDYSDDAHHMFWLYQDLTFFHSKLEQQHPYSDASVHYFCLTEPMVPPPKYTYSSVSTVEESVVTYCQTKTSNKTFAELESLGLNNPKYPTQRICENWKNCKCDARFSALYVANETRNVRFLRDGTIDINSFATDEDRVLIECSDECGCSINCPRRPLQRGQQKSVAVFYEGGNMGFGVRAMQTIKKGDFIMEYTGHLFDSETKNDTFLDTKNGTYDASCSVIDSKRIVIDAEHIGNAARFINHKCTPNAVFIDTESRRNEKDLLIPRISIYALADIAIGESIFLRYWAEGEEDDDGIDCDCQTEDCIKLLPIRMT